MVEDRVVDRGPRIVVALDFPLPEAALRFAERVRPADCRLKVGLELFTAGGPPVVSALVEKGFDVFLDLKYHDIPNTVAMACARAADLGVWMLNVHALGGERMLAAAKEAVAKAGRPPLLIAVTVLTSHTPGELVSLGLSGNVPSTVSRLAGLAARCGLDGVVCSPHEARALRAERGPGFLLVTPGVRPAGADQQDQRRVATPAEALRLGADYLVVGRPITQAADPPAALAALNRELAPA